MHIFVDVLITPSTSKEEPTFRKSEVSSPYIDDAVLFLDCLTPKVKALYSSETSVDI